MKLRTVILVVITIPLLMAKCSKVIAIEDLKEDIFSYQQLPDSVKLLFENAKEFTAISGNSNLLFCEAKLKYTLKASKSVGSYIDYYEITNERTKSKIRIPYGKILPFVIYRNTLYIPTLYNVQNNILKVKQSNYEVYTIP